jgi:hypothetical protein
MNLSKLVSDLPDSNPVTGYDCAAATTSDNLFLTLPNSRTFRSISRSMYDGSRQQPAIVAPYRGSSEKEQGTYLVSPDAASCSERNMRRTSVQSVDVNTAAFDLFECLGHSDLSSLSATWTVSCFNTSALQCSLSQTSAHAFGIGCDSEKGTGHDAD